jgi:hypothetical protein
MLAQLNHNLSAYTREGVASGLAKKLEESASTAPSGNLPTNRAIVHYLALRVYHVPRVPAAVFVPQVFDFLCWSVTAENSRNFLPAR